jgi:hypothetical protein
METTAGMDIPNTWFSRDLRAEIDAEHLGMADGGGEFHLSNKLPW